LIDLSKEARFRRTEEKEEQRLFAGFARLWRGNPLVIEAAQKKFHATLNGTKSGQGRREKAKRWKTQATELAKKSRSENKGASQEYVAGHIINNCPSAPQNDEYMRCFVSELEDAGTIPRQVINKR
jgi:hypothetical protein